MLLFLLREIVKFLGIMIESLYKKRNQVERFFLRIKRFRKVCTRYDKLDSIFLSVIMLAMIFDALFM